MASEQESTNEETRQEESGVGNQFAAASPITWAISVIEQALQANKKNLPRDVVGVVAGYFVRHIDLAVWEETRNKAGGVIDKYKWRRAMPWYERAFEYEPSRLAAYKCGFCYLRGLHAVDVDWARAWELLRLSALGRGMVMGVEYNIRAQLSGTWTMQHIEAGGGGGAVKEAIKEARVKWPIVEALETNIANEAWSLMAECYLFEMNIEENFNCNSAGINMLHVGKDIYSCLYRADADGASVAKIINKQEPKYSKTRHKEKRESSKELRLRAAQGDVRAVCRLGKIALYNHKNFAIKKLDEALSWLRDAAECGDVHAMEQLCNTVPLGEAEKWQREAADQKSPLAMEREVEVLYDDCLDTLLTRNFLNLVKTHSPRILHFLHLLASLDMGISRKRLTEYYRLISTRNVEMITAALFSSGRNVSRPSESPKPCNEAHAFPLPFRFSRALHIAAYSSSPPSPPPPLLLPTEVASRLVDLTSSSTGSSSSSSSLVDVLQTLIHALGNRSNVSTSPPNADLRGPLNVLASFLKQ